MFKRIKSIGNQRGRDFGTLEARALKLRRSSGADAAASLLRFELAEVPADSELRRKDEYTLCRILLMQCEVEVAIATGDSLSALNGLQTLLRVPSTYSSVVYASGTRWQALLREIEQLLQDVLAASWLTEGSKGAFRPVVAATANAWYELQKPAEVSRVCEIGLKVFPDDPVLLLMQAEADSGLGEHLRCLDCLGAFLRATPSIESAGKILTMLQAAQRSPESRISGTAHALAGEIYRRLNRHEQSFEELREAYRLLGDEMDDANLVTYLLACSRLRRADELEALAGRLQRPGLTEEQLGDLAVSVRNLLQEFPNKSRLWLIWATASLRLGRGTDAAEAFRRLLELEKGYADNVVGLCQTLGLENPTEPALCVSLAQALTLLGRTADALKILGSVDCTHATGEQLDAAVAVYRDLAQKLPGDLKTRLALVGLYQRSHRWNEAINCARELLDSASDIRQVTEICGELVAAARQSGVPECVVPTLQLEAEACQKSNDVETLLVALDQIRDEKSATGEQLQWVATRLRDLRASPFHGLRARVMLGDTLQRAGSPKEAAAEYLAVLATQPSADVMQRACDGLEAVWQSADNRGKACAALARGWLLLGRPREARPALLECIRTRESESIELLELLRAQQVKSPPSEEWAALAIEAGLAIGEEPNLAAVVESLWMLLDMRPERSEWIADAAARLRERAKSPETQEAAAQLQSRALILAESLDGFEALTQWLLDNHPDWASAVLEAADDAASQAAVPTRARAKFIMGRLLAAGTPPDIRRAATFYQQAAELDPTACGEEAIAEIVRLVGDPAADGSVIIIAARTAHTLGKAAEVSSVMLGLLDRLAGGFLTDARDFAQAASAQSPDSAAVWLLLGRCEARLGNLQPAVTAFSRLLKFGGESLVAVALEDVHQLLVANPADFGVFNCYLDALAQNGNAKAIGGELLQRIMFFPDQAEQCTRRLELAYQQGGSTWEDAWTYGEALRLSNRAAEAPAVWRRVLAAPDADYERCAVALRQLALALPKDFTAAALLIHVEARVLAPDKMAAVLRRLDQVLAMPNRDATLLPWLLGDCETAEKRAGKREETLRLAAARRAAILSLQGEATAAARELERTVRTWPDEAPMVITMCRRELKSGAAIYLHPLAVAHLLHGDFTKGVEVLRKLADDLPDQLPLCRELCAEFSARATGADAEAMRFFGTELASRAGDYAGAARDYLELLAGSPQSRLAVRQQLQALVTAGVTAPEVHFALADVHLDGEVDAISRAWSVVESFYSADPDVNYAAALEYAHGLVKRFENSLEARLKVLGMLFRDTPSVAEIEGEADEILVLFEQAGARALVEFFERELRPVAAHAAFWHLKARALDQLGNFEASLECLRTLMQVDLEGQAVRVQECAAKYLQGERRLASAAVLLADLARRLRDFARSARHSAEALEMPGADLKLIAAGLEETLAAQPENAEALSALARCQWKQGDGAAAARTYQRAAELPAAPELGDKLKLLCDAFSDTPACWFVRGEYTYRRERRTEALPALERYLAFAPLEPAEQVKALKMAAECHARENRFDEAARCVKHVLELKADDDQAAHRLVELYFDKNSHEIRLLQVALQREGETPALAFEYGRLLHARGDYDDAARWFRKVPREHPLGNESLLYAGRCRLALNQCHLAAVAFKSVLSNSPKPPERHAALYHLGTAYSSLLDFAKAVQAFEELCIEDPGYQDAAQQLQKAHEQMAAGETMRVAEIPFDVLTAWRNIATHQNQSAQDKSAAA